MENLTDKRPRALGITVTLLVVIAILSPLNKSYRGAYGDSFPLSWYPMFSRPRPKLERTNYVQGIDSQGEAHMLKSSYYVKGGMNQARRQLSHLVQSRKTAKETCRRAAANVAKSKRSRFSDWQTIKVMRGRFNMRTYFELRQKEPVKTRTFATCPIKRKPPLSPSNQGKL